KISATPNEISYGGTISACEKGGQWQLGLSLLSSLPDLRLAPDGISFTSAMSACEKASEWQLTLGLLSSMLDLRLAPDEFSCSCALTACEKAGYFQLPPSILSRLATMSVARLPSIFCRKEFAVSRKNKLDVVFSFVCVGCRLCVLLVVWLFNCLSLCSELLLLLAA
ncbi:unnamed protein product, partial [Polarella glacialis]